MDTVREVLRLIVVDVELHDMVRRDAKDKRNRIRNISKRDAMQMYIAATIISQHRDTYFLVWDFRVDISLAPN